MGSSLDLEYIALKDLNLEIINRENGGFTLCFWVFLTSPISYPFTILQQFLSDNADKRPFLALDEEKILTLSPFSFMHKESQNPYVSATKVFPIGVWVHVGIEVTVDIMRLYYGGDIVGEKHLNSSFSSNEDSDSSIKMSLSGPDADGDRTKGYIHRIEVLSSPSSIKDHLIKDPPQQLLVDPSTVSEIEEEDDDGWSIAGGKASCRRNITLDVVLMDAFGKPVNKEIEVVASLVYADNGLPVKRPSDVEGPLLTSHDGIEFTSSNRPSKLVNGRASFKLKISQLSSKCDNRVFLIRFDIPSMREYPFLITFSSPVPCTSRGHGMRPSLICKRPDIAHNNGVHEAKSSPSSKRVKLGQVNSFSSYKTGVTLDQADEGNSRACTPDEIDCSYENRVEQRIRANNEESGKSTSDSDSIIGARNSNDLKSMSPTPSSSAISDSVIYKYCLGSLSERALMLKDIATLATQRQLVDFAHHVSQYLECSHHRHQIMMAKRLVEEGTKAWDLLTQSNSHVKWVTVETEIKRQFMMISRSSNSFTQQDMEILRRIGGCKYNEYVGPENFEKIWCWLYPVALTISRDCANGLWKSWIEGVITKEEAEGSLRGSWGVQEPGTFVLRFPTSRSWPHPDAGNLVITYVGTDYSIHHRLLSLDLIYYSEKPGSVRSIEELLLEEPEISRLGRIIRSAQ